jgi:hypothetical protein
MDDDTQHHHDDDTSNSNVTYLLPSNLSLRELKSFVENIKAHSSKNGIEYTDRELNIFLNYLFNLQESFITKASD